MEGLMVARDHGALCADQHALFESAAMALKQKRAVEAQIEAAPTTRVYDPTVFSTSEIAINCALDLVEAWVDRYLVTPLLGPSGSAPVKSAFLARSSWLVNRQTD